MLVLAALSALAWVSGVATATRLYPESRAERGLAAAVIALAEIVFTAQTLGWTSSLTALSLGFSMFVLSALVLAATLFRRDPRTWARELRDSVREQLLLPVSAVREAWRARSFTAVSLVATMGVVVWTFWLAWLAPTGAWDGLMYHEPMVGFAIQSHDMAREVVIPAQMPLMNGYPRMSETLMLWLVIFSDHRLIDALPSLITPVSMLATYVIAARFSTWRVGAMAIACVLVTIPGAVLQLRSTYVDLEMLATFMAALAFVTSPRFAARDIWMAALALGLLAGTKSSGIAYVGVIAGIAFLRTIALMVRSRSGWPFAHALPALALLAALGAPQYVRNWRLHENPVWPLKYEIKSLGITLDGPTDIQNLQWGPDQMLHELFGVPVPGEDYHDTRRHAYGYGLTFVALPLFFVALVAALAAWLRALVTRDVDERRKLSLLGIVVAVGTLTLVTSPAFYWARYSLPLPAVGLVLITWLCGRRGRTAFGDAALAAMLVLNLITLRWAEPAWDVTPELAWQLARMPSSERMFVNTSHCLWPPDVLRMREDRIHRGDLVVVDSQVAFLGNCWNDHFTNRVEYVPFTTTEAYLARLESLHAKWVYGKQFGPETAALRTVPTRWHEIGRGRDDEPIYERVHE